VKPVLQAPQVPMELASLQSRFSAAQAMPTGPTQASFAHPVEAQASQRIFAVLNLKFGSHWPATHTASMLGVWVHSWLGTQVPPSILSWLHETPLRHCMLDISHTSPPEHVEVELHAQPTMSVLHIWQRLVLSQYAFALQTGPWVRHGQPGAPATQVSGTQVPLLQLRPALHMSPAPHAQPSWPAGHVSHAPDAQRRPMSQVLLARHTHAAEPR